MDRGRLPGDDDRRPPASPGPAALEPDGALLRVAPRGQHPHAPPVPAQGGGPGAPPDGPGPVLLQPPQLDRPVPSLRPAAASAPALLLRPEGGRPPGRAAEPAHVLDRDGGPVPAGQDGPPR